MATTEQAASSARFTLNTGENSSQKSVKVRWNTAQEQENLPPSLFEAERPLHWPGYAWSAEEALTAAPELQGAAAGAAK